MQSIGYTDLKDGPDNSWLGYYTLEDMGANIGSVSFLRSRMLISCNCQLNNIKYQLDSNIFQETTSPVTQKATSHSYLRRKTLILMYVLTALILANIELNRSTRLQEFPWRQMVLVVIQLRNVTTLHLVNSHNEKMKKRLDGFQFSRFSHKKYFISVYANFTDICGLFFIIFNVSYFKYFQSYLHVYFELFVHGASYVVQICYRIEMLQLLS